VEAASAAISHLVSNACLTAAFFGLSGLRCCSMLPTSCDQVTCCSLHDALLLLQVVVFTRSQPNSIWDMQWTGDDGTASFFLVPK
jgi:hypothetical protein